MKRKPCRLCSRPRHTHGLCHTHAERWRRWGRPLIDEWVAAFLEGRLRTCEICLKPFNGYHNSKTCSGACDAERRRRTSLARWYAKPPEARKAISAAKPKKRRPKVQHQCVICGEMFTGAANWKTCSEVCREAHRTMTTNLHHNKARGAEKLAKLNTLLEDRNERPRASQ